MQTLGVAIIARNAQSTIKSCIESFKDYVDQIVVVLAGESTDKTEEIVRSIEGVEVYPFAWIDDFSAARNFSFSKLKTDWFCWVDADDEIYQPENMRKLINEAKDEVGAIWLSYHYAIDEFGNVTTMYERERLLRAKYGWIWKDRLHETVSPLQQCIFVRSDEVIIRHNHLAGASRNDRNFHLLNIMLKEQPDNKRVWLYLGHQNFAAGNWADAAEWYLKFGSDQGAIFIERYQSLCYCAKAMREMGDNQQAIDVSLMAIEVCPDYKDAYIEMAQCYLRLGQFDKAIHWAAISDVKELIKEPPHVIFINPMEYTFNKYAMLSECYMKKGQMDTALDWMMRAYQIRPDEGIKNNLQYLNELNTRSKVSNSIKTLAITLLNNKEITKLNSLLDCTPFWFRDLDDYKELKAGVERYSKDIKDEPQIVEGENNSVMVNLANSIKPVELLESLDKYDRVTIVCPFPKTDDKQISVYSQRDMENLVMSKPGRHIINLQREAIRMLCEYDKNIPEKSVRMYLGQGFENWNPKTINEIGCGGSETCAAMVCKEFAKLNWASILYAMDTQVWDGVIYRHFSNYKPDTLPSSLFISSRVPDIFYADIPAEVKCLWFHDIHCWDRFTPEVAERIDAIICLSQWHAGHLKRVYPFLKDAEIIDFDQNPLTYDDQWTGGIYYPDVQITKLPKIAIIGNGIDTEKFKNITEEKVPHRFIWCSSPDRGLEQVLLLWPLIKKNLPDAQLKIFYGWEYFNTSLFIPTQRELKQRLWKLIRQEGVEWCGRVGQIQLASELMKADIMLYPPPHDFRETYGIAFLEAQAAGVLCFYRQNGALGETIGNRGIPLKLDATQDEIVEQITHVIIDKERCEHLRQKGKEYAFARDWSIQTGKMLSLYERLMGG